MQGMLVMALKAGHWVLLDEINLASAETLECLSGLLESSIGSVVLADRGSVALCVFSPLLFLKLWKQYLTHITSHMCFWHCHQLKFCL